MQCSYLAVVSQDGQLRVFHHDTMELVGTTRSYFGGLLCVCWSPDGKVITLLKSFLHSSFSVD